MLRYPDVGRTHICFVYANNVWMVNKSGGVATPVASPSGQESFPRFSADDSTIAFVGNYDGNRDIYTVDVSGGGQAERVTHHPGGETLCDWTPDGTLLFLTNAMGGLTRQSQLFEVDAEGGLPKKLAVPYSGFAAVSPNGEWLAYTPHSTDNRTWKRYRGGMATDIWLFNLKDESAKKVTDWEGTDTIPMWIPGSDGSTVYFLSDKGDEHRLNLWSYNVGTETLAQVTRYTDFDIRWPSVGPGSAGKGEFVFQLGSELRLFDIASGKDAVVKVTIPGDRPSVRKRTVDASKNVNSASISPSGKRVAIEGRGDVYSVPAKEGVSRNFTRSDGVYERDVAWSPDGRWIAYFSDESGDYELWVRPSDAKAPEKKDEKKDDKDKPGSAKAEGDSDAKDEKNNDGATGDDAAKSDDLKSEKPAADGAEPEAEKPIVPVPDPKKLTTFGPGFRFSPTWSPDSKWIALFDKAGAIMIVDAKTGETRTIDTDPFAEGVTLSWSHDSAWLAYDRNETDLNTRAIFVYHVKDGKSTRLTSSMFATYGPAFDAKGDWLFAKSNRAVSNPIYSDLDTTYVYTGTEVLLAIPLRADVKDPFAAKLDEETFKEEEEKKDDKKDDAEKDDAEKKKDDGDKKDDKPAEVAAVDDGVSGTWVGTASVPAGDNQANIPFTLIVKLGADKSLTGSIVSAMGQGAISNGSYDKDSGSITFNIAMGGVAATLTGKITGEEASGTWTAGDESGKWQCKRTSKGSASASRDGDKADDKKKEDAKPVTIEFDGAERRAVQLPLAPGRFGRLAANDSNHLVFARLASRGSVDAAAIKIFDFSEETKEEKTVTPGGNFDISADRKKLLVFRGGANLAIVDASAGGGKSLNVPTDALKTSIDPRDEWRQIFNDAWRLQRDFFYDAGMHGVDWDAMKRRYGAMIEDCANREDVSFVLAELISELNIGHAYVTNPGEVENAPTVPVGLLGCDFELVTEGDDSAYRISKIYSGGDWDSDARSPLEALGVNVKVGDFLLAVNGVPVETDVDPWFTLIGTADKVTSLTVNSVPRKDGKERDVVVKPLSSETGLRFRDWIEAKRKYVEEKSDGKVGYIYVPNTGVDGQSELYRQFFGQRNKVALIIDERWNGGGQIPTRFIELLNRPVLNYWARRDGNDWTWPPDAHNGPKAMLINGLAGSGGDMFPALFRQQKIGTIIGTRTWGGLVGITGDPQLIDGGEITVPRFAYYEKDGTWGIEGHGVDPDIEVLDDPAILVKGIDPQIDKAIEVLLEQAKASPYAPPKRPAGPNRKGMGLDPRDR